MADIIGEADIEIGADATPFENEARKATESAGNRIVSGMKKVGQTASDALSASMRLGVATAATGIGVVLGTAITSGMKRLSAIDTAEARLRGLGQSAEQVEAVMAQVNDAVMGTYFSTADMADAASLLLTSGVQAGDDLSNALEGVKGVAAATGSELGDVTNIWTKMAAKGKVSGRELNQVMDMGINGAMALAEHFGVTAEEAEKMVSAGKVSFEDFNAAIVAATGNMADEVAKSFEGMKVSIIGWLGLVGEQLDKPFFEAAKKIMPAIEGVMAEMPAAIESAMGPVGDVMDRFADGIVSKLEGIDVGGALSGFTEFASQTSSLLLPAITGLLGALGPLIAQIPIVGKLFSGITGPVGIAIGLFIEMFRNSETLRDAFSQLFETLGNVFTSLEPVLTAISDLIGIVAGTLGDVLGEVIIALLPIIESLADILGQVLGPILDALNPIIEAIGDVLVSLLGAGLDLVLAAVLPLIEMALPLLVDLLELLVPGIELVAEWITNLAEMIADWADSASEGTSIFGEAWEWLMDILEPIIDWFQEVVGPAFEALWEGIQEATAAFTEWWGENVQPVFDEFVEFVSVMVEAIGEYFTWLWNNAQAIWSAIGDAWAVLWADIQAIWDKIGPPIMAVIEGAFEQLKTVLAFIWEAIKAVVETVLGVIKGIIKTVTSAIRGDWKGVWEGIKQIFSSVWDGIKKYVSAAIEYVSSTISNVLSTIKGVWDSVWSQISSFFSDIWSGMKTAASNGINNVYQTVIGIKDKILGFFSSAGTWLLDAGKKILSGLADGIRNGISAATSAIGDAVGAVRSYMPFSPAKVGPFSGRGWTPYSGKALVEGFAEGIRSQRGQLDRAMREVLGGNLGASASLTLASRNLGSRAARPATTNVNASAKIDRDDLEYLARRIGREVLSGIDAVSRTNIEDAYASFQRG